MTHYPLPTPNPDDDAARYWLRRVRRSPCSFMVHLSNPRGRNPQQEIAGSGFEVC